MSADLVGLAAEINEINRANGWEVLEPEQWTDPYKIPALLALIHSEVSEALRQATHSHHDRARLANVLRGRGHSINKQLTQTYRRSNG